MLEGDTAFVMRFQVIPEPVLCSFLDALHQQMGFARELTQRTNKFLAEKFSPFCYLEVAEPKLSLITADLLQPDGTHGQGDVFLRAFLRALGIAERDAHVQIRTEQPTRFIESIQRRVDIKLFWSDFIVGIENKPWALDQPNQLEDYVNDLDRESKGHFLCVYLSRDGLPPEQSSISSERRILLERRSQLKILSYPKIMCAWLDECIRECEADKVRWFLRDFREYLLRQFPVSDLEGRTMNISDDVIVAYALLNKHNLELASAVGARFSRIKSAVICKFAEALENELVMEPNVVVFRNEIKSDPLSKWAGLYFGKEAWRDKYSIGLSSWATGNACGFYFGIVKDREREGRILPFLATRLDSEFGRGAAATPDWDWYQRLKEPYRDWDNEHILVSMYEPKRGEALTYFVTLLLRLFKLAEQDIDAAIGKDSEE
jgi:hypothetical protein